MYLDKILSPRSKPLLSLTPKSSFQNRLQKLQHDISQLSTGKNRPKSHSKKADCQKLHFRPGIYKQVLARNPMTYRVKGLMPCLKIHNPQRLCFQSPLLEVKAAARYGQSSWQHGSSNLAASQIIPAFSQASRE